MTGGEYIYIYTHTHTHTHPKMFQYVNMCVYINLWNKLYPSDYQALYSFSAFSLNRLQSFTKLLRSIGDLIISLL